MPIKASPIGNIYNWETESDIVELTYTHSSRLRVIIDTRKNKFSPIFVEVVFPFARGFRYLDEGDLIRYWESDEFKEGYHVYDILNGGWITGEKLDTGLLSVSSSVGQKEWFVVTTNYCMTVVGAGEPLIREFPR
jgi:hypothetical protein